MEPHITDSYTRLIGETGRLISGEIATLDALIFIKKTLVFLCMAIAVFRMDFSRMPWLHVIMTPFVMVLLTDIPRWILRYLCRYMGSTWTMQWLGRAFIVIIADYPPKSPSYALVTRCLAMTVTHGGDLLQTVSPIDARVRVMSQCCRKVWRGVIIESLLA